MLADDELISRWRELAQSARENDLSSDDYGEVQAFVYEQCANELETRQPEEEGAEWTTFVI